MEHVALNSDGGEIRSAGRIIGARLQRFEDGAGIQPVCSDHDPSAETVGWDIVRIIGGDDAGPEPLIRQLVDRGDAATPVGIKG